MSDPINEFSMNLPVVSPGMLAAPAVTPEPQPASYDITAAQSVPVDISPEYSHISVSPMGVDIVDAEGPCTVADLMLSVCVTDPNTGTRKTYKIVKRLSMDKLKLACDAECMTPISIVEAEEDILVVKQEMDAFYAARRAREVAGLSESAGQKQFKVFFSYTDEKAESRASGSVVIDKVRDKAHARHVFSTKNASKFSGVKITRIEEVA